MPTQVEKLRKFQWWGGGLTSTPWNGNSKGVGGGGSKANVPSVVRGGGRDIFCNYILCLLREGVHETFIYQTNGTCKKARIW